MQKNNDSATLILIVSAVIALSAGVWFGFDSSKPVSVPGIQGMVLPSPKLVDNFELTDHQNKQFSRENLKNKWSLVFVGYTNCPDICPTTLNTVKQVHNLMLEQQLSPPQMVFISADPERDTPERLNEYVSYFNPEFIGATGKLDALTQLAKNLGVFFKKAAGSSGDINASDYLVDHSASLILTNPEGNISAYLSAPHTPMKIIDSIIRSQEYYKQIN